MPWRLASKESTALMISWLVWSGSSLLPPTRVLMTITQSGGGFSFCMKFHHHSAWSTSCGEISHHTAVPHSWSVTVNKHCTYISPNLVQIISNWRHVLFETTANDMMLLQWIIAYIGFETKQNWLQHHFQQRCWMKKGVCAYLARAMHIPALYGMFNLIHPRNPCMGLYFRDLIKAPKA